MLKTLAGQLKTDLSKIMDKLTPKYPGFLDTVSPKQEFQVTLSQIKKISPDSYIYTYDLPDTSLPLGLMYGHHVAIHADVPNGERVDRKYTPTSRFDQKGSFDLLIKIYRANVHPDHPNGGQLTSYLESLKVGDKVTMSGPKYKRTYLGHGKVNVLGNLHEVKDIVFIAGGTGVAPLYQLILALLDDPTDQTNLHILFANKSEADILLREELEEAAKDPRIKVHYTVDTASPTWKGYTGFITKEMLADITPKPETKPLLWACGPKPMHKLVKSLYSELGYDVEKNIL